MIWWMQVFGLFYREVKRFLSIPFQALGSPLINSALYLMIFGVGIGHFIDAPIGESYLEFLIPGLILMNVIRGTYENTSYSIVGAKYMNELQDLRTTPISRFQIILGLISSSTLRGIVVAILTFAVGSAFSYGMLGKPLVIHHPLFFSFFIIIGGASFATLALTIALVSKTFEQISLFGSFILTPLIYLGGVFFSLEMLSPLWRKIALINPLYYLVEGMRYAMLSDNDLPFFLEVFILTAFFILINIIAYQALNQGRRYVK